MDTIVTITEGALSANPSLADGLTFLSKDSEAQVRHYTKPAPVAEPEPVKEVTPTASKKKGK